MNIEPSNPDFPLPVFGETASSVWGLPEPVPSTILLALPGETMPSEGLLRTALSVVGAEASRFVELDVPLNGPPFALWVIPIGLSEHPIPLIAWCEKIEHPEGLPEIASEALTQTSPLAAESTSTARASRSCPFRIPEPRLISVSWSTVPSSSVLPEPSAITCRDGWSMSGK